MIEMRYGRAASIFVPAVLVFVTMKPTKASASRRGTNACRESSQLRFAREGKRDCHHAANIVDHPILNPEVRTRISCDKRPKGKPLRAMPLTTRCLHRVGRIQPILHKATPQRARRHTCRKRNKLYSVEALALKRLRAEVKLPAKTQLPAKTLRHGEMQLPKTQLHAEMKLPAEMRKA